MTTESPDSTAEGAAPANLRASADARSQAGPYPQTDERTTPTVRATLAQARMELRLLLRSGESLIVTFGIPLGFLLFFGSIDVLPTGSGDPVAFLVPGMLALSVAATGLVAVAIQTAFERKYGVLKRIGGTPLSRTAFLVAKALAVAVLVAVQTGLVILLAVSVLGWRPGGWLLIVPLLLLGTVTFTALGLLMAGTLKAEATLAASNAVFLVLLVISGAAFDAGTLPDSLAAVGSLLPLGALVEAVRAAVDTASVAWGAVTVVAGWGAVAVAIASRAFRWEP